MVVEQDDQPSLVPAFSVAEVMFPLTNFWEPLYKSTEIFRSKEIRLPVSMLLSLRSIKGKQLPKPRPKFSGRRKALEVHLEYFALL